MKKTIAKNKKARFNYFIEDDYEAGISLKGSEVKSIRAGHVSLDESFVHISESGIVSWVNGYIKEYTQANTQNHETRRSRQLLLKKKEIKKISEAISRKGYTIVPLELYFSKQFIKLKIALGLGKKKYDKRETLKEKDAKRDMDIQAKKLGSH